MIKDRYEEILEKISSNAKKCGRKPEDVHLLVVTKGQTSEKIRQVINAGARYLGENYPEETHVKILELQQVADDVEWHMIGHLQSRKIKFVVEHFSMIHSIDRESIALDLDRALAGRNKSLGALVELNLTGEESKQGFSAVDESKWSEVIDSIYKLKSCEKLNLDGFMTMPPLDMNPENSRPIFAKCRRFLEEYQRRTSEKQVNQLSMGTSIDYEVAIQEGATFVRVGQAIMGERNYK